MDRVRSIPVAALLVAGLTVAGRGAEVGTELRDECRCCVPESFGETIWHSFTSGGDPGDPCKGEETEIPSPLLNAQSNEDNQQLAVISRRLQGPETRVTSNRTAKGSFTPVASVRSHASAPVIRGEVEAGCWAGKGVCLAKAAIQYSGGKWVPDSSHSGFHGVVFDIGCLHQSCSGEETEYQEAILDAWDNRNYTELASRYDKKRDRVTLNEDRGLLQIWDCKGRISAQVPVDVYRLEEALEAHMSRMHLGGK